MVSCVKFQFVGDFSRTLTHIFLSAVYPVPVVSYNEVLLLDKIVGLCVLVDVTELITVELLDKGE